MSKPRPPESFIEYRRRMLDPISPSFCAAKWYNTTIWLGSGRTASCHLPPAHSIDAKDLRKNPSALHNTEHKQAMRALMLSGERPPECEYCWKIEDIHRDNVSDRIFKSNIYSDADIQKIPALGKAPQIKPKTLEIAFDRSCNFACSYCNPAFSTTWAKDLRQNGVYQNLKSDAKEHYNNTHDDEYPYSNETNPFLHAFWEWWPEIVGELEELRVTGGEPLLSPYIWDLFDYFGDVGDLHKLRFAVNSNLGARDEIIDRLIEKSHYIRHFDLYTSNESVGTHAEYIRDGMNYSAWLANLEKILRFGKINSLNIMMTINGLCLFSLPDFLEVMLQWKKNFRPSFISLSTNILRFPSFQSALILPNKILVERRAALQNFLHRHSENPYLLNFEKENLRRLVDYLDVVKSPHRFTSPRADLVHDFVSFHRQYDQRRNKNLAQTFPDLADWYQGLTT